MCTKEVQAALSIYEIQVKSVFVWYRCPLQAVECYTVYHVLFPGVPNLYHVCGHFLL